MNRDDFKKISVLRQKEARALFDKGHYEGAYYLLGYSVECALKACIAKKIKRHEFPNKKFVNDSHTHSLSNLLNLADLKSVFEKESKKVPNLEVNWTTVKDWSEQKRYEKSISQTLVRDLFSACTARTYGILPWLRKRW